MIYYIHGANSCPATFNYFKLKLPKHEFIDVSYNCHTSIMNTLDQIAKNIGDKEIDIIGHSLGGVIGIALSNRVNVRKLVSISSPFGGSVLASYLRWIFPSSLLNDIRPNSPLIREVLSTKINFPVLSFITTNGGSTLVKEPNDGVVSVASQKALKNTTQIEISTNHFVGLLLPEVADEIEKFLNL